MLSLLGFSANLAAEDELVLEQLVWDFSDFVSSFESRNWQQVFHYVTDETKAGLGSEQGIDGVKQVYAADKTCFNNMLFALKQGCKKMTVGSHVECFSPPSWADPQVVSLGSRASFVYSEERRTWVVSTLICGGD